ncbi:MAG: hypothetical protein ACYDEQ_07435 [Desulfocucumaceae bacterium]
MREELIYAEVGGFYRPGKYGAFIGSLGEDLEILTGIKGIKDVCTGLIDNQTFESTTLLLFMAARQIISEQKVTFPSNLSSAFLTDKYIINTFFLPDSKAQKIDLYENIALYIKKSSEDLMWLLNCHEEKKQIIYVDISGVHLPLKELCSLSGPDIFKGPGTPSVVLVKTSFPSGTRGVYREIACCTLIDEKTP